MSVHCRIREYKVTAFAITSVFGTDFSAIFGTQVSSWYDALIAQTGFTCVRTNSGRARTLTGKVTVIVLSVHHLSTISRTVITKGNDEKLSTTTLEGTSFCIYHMLLIFFLIHISKLFNKSLSFLFKNICIKYLQYDSLVNFIQSTFVFFLSWTST